MAVELRTIPAVNPGTNLKFRLTTTKDDFTLASDKWNIVIKNNLGRTTHRITKNDCYYDTEGRYYFNILNPQPGTYTAIFVGAYEDEDYPEDRRIWTDRQVLFVCREGCMMRQRRKHHPSACPVQYEQVWACSLNGDDYLCDCYGRYILTAEGDRIQFTNNLSNEQEEMGKVKLQMTGEQFLQLIEGKDPNGAVNTIPELMQVMTGISDDKTVIEEIDEELDDNTPERVTPEDLDNFEV